MKGGNRMGEDMNGYQPPVVEGLDGDDSSGVSTYGTEWVWVLWSSFFVTPQPNFCHRSHTTP